ncbi:hypothetical protein ACFP2T_43310 [Plantactinospora solaniradicis]|uniref:Uncharacterized protein n=1 Tax=Plantactinospora solaniradicis TaxID=1723736 RepID=A0ABW1KMD9_9ACTN
MTDVVPGRHLRIVETTTTTQRVVEVPEARVIQENRRLRQELGDALWKLEMALAELELARLDTEELLSGPHVMNPSYVVPALYPDEDEVRKLASTRWETRAR